MAENSTDKETVMYDSKLYTAFRRDTPEEIVSKIMCHLKEKCKGTLNIAVDVGCGSGQGTIVFAPFFEKVYGIDCLETQIQQAESSRMLKNVIYKTGPSEILPFDDGSVQLITAATSLHWFDLDAFFPESRRVLCNNGILAVYGYMSMKPLLQSPSNIAKLDKLFEELNEAFSDFSKPQIKIFFQKYQNIKFPFEEVIREPDVRCLFKGKISDIVGYIKTYSCYKSCVEQNPLRGKEIIEDFEKRLYDIAASENIPVDDLVTLYQDHMLIICRKIA